MKLPKFDLGDARWDDHKAFYNKHGIFTQFDTGELVMRATSRLDPTDRRLYKEFNLRVTMTTDDDCPSFKTPDGESVSKAELTRPGIAGQLLVIDTDQEMAVGLDYTFKGKPDGWRESLPKRFKYWVGFYCGGDGELPRGAPIIQGKVFSAERKQPYTDMEAQCRAWAKLDKSVRNDGRDYLDKDGSITHHYSLESDPVRLKLPGRFKDLTPRERLAIANHGFKIPFDNVEHPYLLLR